MKLRSQLLVVAAFCCFSVSPAQALTGEIRVLVAGFEPFGSHETNPSQEVAGILAERSGEYLPGNMIVESVVLPVTYDQAWPVLERAIEEHEPDIVLGLGLAASSPGFRVETLARNEDRGYADNLGVRHSGEIVPGGPAVLPAFLPVEAVARSLRDAGYAVQLSDDAGGYLCNNIFYHLMEHVRQTDVAAGFVHLPMAEAEGEQGLARGVAVILETLARAVARVAVVEFEPVPDSAEENLARMERIVRGLARREVEVVLFPEMAFLGLAHASVRELETGNPIVLGDGGLGELSRMARESNVYLGAGLVLREHGSYYNGYVLMDSQGRETLRYLKNHLYGDDFNWALPGQGGYPVADLPMGRVGMLICHDVVYRESFEPYATAGVDWLIIGTNWIGPTPMLKYLSPWGAHIPVILTSDRKGEEDGAVFYGNTQILALQGQLLPSPLPEGGRAAIAVVYGR